MSGLMLKDFKLMLNQKKMILIIFVITLLFGLTGENMLFIVSYSSMMGVFLTVSTISYDEFDNGYAFLFTLPVTRKGYAVEKYVFSLLTGSVIWALAVLLGVVLGQGETVSMSEWLMGSAGILAALYLMMFFMIPIRLKFGAEKGRIATIAILVGFMTVITGLNELQESMNLNINADWVLNLPFSSLLVIGTVLLAATGILSLLLSIKIVEKKQF